MTFNHVGGDRYCDNEKFLDHAVGKVTYDGEHVCMYDAWNRLVQVNRAYRDSGGTLQEKSVIATMTYDGLGRRIKKVVAKRGDWDCTYHFYYDGHRMIETRNGSNDVLKSRRAGIWGQTYVDELVQIGINDDPTDASEARRPLQLP